MSKPPPLPFDYVLNEMFEKLPEEEKMTRTDKLVIAGGLVPLIVVIIYDCMTNATAANIAGVCIALVWAVVQWAWPTVAVLWVLHWLCKAIGSYIDERDEALRRIVREEMRR